MRTKILLLASTLLPILTLHAIVDTNDNGLSDLWEKQHNDNGLFPETFDPEADPDSDGWTNAQEAAAGTDPFSTAHPLGHLQPETVQLPETWVDTDNDNIPDSLVPESIQVSWPTIPGKQYTFQSNATLAPDNWINVGSPFIGAGTVVNYGFFTTAAAKTFWRVNITDIDSDGDDLTDWEENELGTNPLHRDSDGDGLSDGWEITNSLDANDDRDRDGVLNSVDAEADEPLIDWQPSARPVFAVIELDVTDVENLMLDDLTETGTILLSNDTTTPNTRILVDRWQKVITFPAWGEGGPSAFSSNGPTLIGDTLPGERLINNLSKGYLMIPEMNGTQSFQPWENPTNYLDSIKDSRNGTTIAVDWLGPNPNWTNPGLGRFPDGNPLPNEETTASRGARIEADGNMVSDKVYWRKDPQTGNPGNAIPLPSVPTAVHSATVTQVTTGPTGAIEENHWNLVATHQGLLVSKNEGDFTSASGALAGVACDGVTRQGWIIDRTNQRIRSNGEWKTLLQLLGDGFSQAELLGILDTGLAVAKVKSSEPEADFKLALLLPVEVAPEVLAVNSDFDEGRIDPATGYAIPDCDDSNIALEAVRNHLDGKFSINERITDDMHPGFFGVNPLTLGDDFWTGANVTIRKIDKTDPATGHPESGHIRLYGKWGNGPSEYRAIVPYNFETLATTNLTTGGLNGTSESVYGATSPFPDGTSYFIECVHPGKITLEWRYQKGSLDFKHEQSFEVCTHKNAIQWKHDLAYKIRLETSNDPSGEINTIGVMAPGESYKERMERASEYYDFYQDCFLTPLRSKPLHTQAITWPGLARLAGSQVVGGLSDSEYARIYLEVGSIPGSVLPQPILSDFSRWSLNETKDLQQALFTGARTIFQSIGWQMHAYRSSGYRALDWVETETGEAEVSALSGVWLRLRKGILDHDKVTLDKVALDITDREQNVTIVPTWSVISGLFGGTADWMFSVLGENSCTPSGKDFREIFPQFPVSTGSLANAANRWTWIQPATADGILDTWNKHPLAARDTLVKNTLEQDSRRFSRVHQIAYQFPTYLYLPIWVWDDEDVP